jgi:hypothetical protein
MRTPARVKQSRSTPKPKLQIKIACAASKARFADSSGWSLRIATARTFSSSSPRNHLRHCATEAIRKGSSAQAEAMYDELLHLIYTHAR